MLHRASIPFYRDGGVGVRTAVGRQKKGVAFRVVFATLEPFAHDYLAPVAGAPFANADGFGNDVGRSVVRRMDHFGPRILMLARVCQGDGDDFPARAPALEHHSRVFHGEAGANVAVYPADFRIFHGKAAFGDHVEDIGGPVCTVTY